MSVVWKNTLEGDAIQQLDAFAGQSVGKAVWAARSHALQMCRRSRQDRAARGIGCGPRSRALARTPLHRCVRKRGETGTPDATQEKLVPSSDGILHKSLLVQKPSKQISQEVSEKPTSSDAIRSRTITTSSTHTPQEPHGQTDAAQGTQTVVQDTSQEGTCARARRLVHSGQTD